MKSPAAGARMKMKDLERAAGVGRETIRYYIREGLLPEPQRPRRNVAWYDRSFVERLALIKELQQKRFLPLHVIRSIVGVDAPPSRDEVRTLLELDGKLFPAVAGAPTRAPERLQDVARRVRIPAREIREFAAVGMIELVTLVRGHARSPSKEGDGGEWLDEAATCMVELWGKLREGGYDHRLGFTAASFRVYPELVRWLAREELRLFTRGVTGRVSPETSVRMAEIGINCINQMLGLLRKATLLRYIAQGNLPASDDVATLPSAVARARRGGRRGDGARREGRRLRR